MGDLLGSPRVATLSFSRAWSIPGLETEEVVFLDSGGGTDRRCLSHWIEWEILPQMHILCVEFRRTEHSRTRNSRGCFSGFLGRNRQTKSVTMDRMGDSAPNAYIMRRIPTYGPKVTPRTDNYDL
ncbi:hypothetical protein Lal_00042072 [Lupinus albus]|nr:hypothetical protein Lal_00042072 [Lupinus albus]